ncbi:oxygen tolerance domain protein [Pantoea sp. Pa-EAmG]|uniref:oxygen tolerance domain protein n=1 Tax=Pantoea sp. Pa-EAmG TaxID=3043311 RepID=UPI0024AE9193|nr:oxygen tolerance domain protein [Pantoea sp. Pa-EAmG]MDI6958088.1 oxygen tolerance domain protein [Pantoea sp. Pa-EAmG]
MRALLLCLIILVLPVRAAMDITRELVVPDQLVPGQPLRVAITFWTDSWFNPPPQWPDFTVENGALLPTNVPNQLVNRNVQGVSWSGIRMERQLMAWDQGTLRIPSLDVTLQSAGQVPKTATLPALETAVNWPTDVEQPDRFLPAASLALTQKITLYRAVNDNTLHVGDVIERQITLGARDVIAAQIPAVLIDLPGSTTQKLADVNTPLVEGRDEIVGTQRVERLRYLPDTPGSLVLPAIKLRWWNTVQHQWQWAELPGARYTLQPARAAGAEQTLQSTRAMPWWQVALIVVLMMGFAVALWFTRPLLWRALCFAVRAWQRLWHVTVLPSLLPHPRRKS